MKIKSVSFLIIIIILSIGAYTAVAMPAQKPTAPPIYQKVSMPLSGRLDVECKDGFLYLEGIVGDVYQWRCIR